MGLGASGLRRFSLEGVWLGLGDIQFKNRGYFEAWSGSVKDSESHALRRYRRASRYVGIMWGFRSFYDRTIACFTRPSLHEEVLPALFKISFISEGCT